MALRGKKNRSHFRTWFLICLLAIFCIGGAELMVCRVMDPALYERMTSPAKETLAVVEVKLQAAKVHCLATKDRWVASVQAKKEAEPLEDQLAADPEIAPDNNNMADRNLAKFEENGGNQLLIGGNVPIVYFNQADETWKGKPYGSDTIGGYGCGPTAMSMIVSTLSKQVVNPEEMAKWARENGHWAKKQGSYLSIVQGAADAFGLCAEPINEPTADSLRRELASGKLVIALMTKGHFTNGGHFILLRGATLEGGILVADPSSRERSRMVWDAQLILNELSASRAHGAPLWSVWRKLSPSYAG